MLSKEMEIQAESYHWSQPLSFVVAGAGKIDDVGQRGGEPWITIHVSAIHFATCSNSQ